MPTLDHNQLYSQRSQAVRLRREEGLSYTAIARRLGHSRQWASRWCQRDDLWNRSSRPRRSPHQTAPDMEARIVDRARQTGWGRRRLHRQIRWELREQPDLLARLPSPSGIERIRERHGLIKRRRHRAPRSEPRDYGEPDALGEGDIMVDP